MSITYDENEVAVFEACHVRAATEKAALIRFGNHIEAWVPQSQIHEDSEIWKAGDKGKLVLKRWFVEKQGWTEWES